MRQRRKSLGECCSIYEFSTHFFFSNAETEDANEIAVAHDEAMMTLDFRHEIKRSKTQQSSLAHKNNCFTKSQVYQPAVSG